MINYRYKLEKGSKKYRCPACHKKRFVRYLDSLKNEYLPIQFGRCDRADKCGYFHDPYSSGYAKEVYQKEIRGKSNVKVKKPKTKQRPKQTQKPETVYFDFETFKKTLGHYDKNGFIQNLLKRVPFPFELKAIEKLIELYRLGTVATGYRKEAVCFPFIDQNNHVRTIQVKQFDRSNHTKSTDFLHSMMEKHFKNKKIPLPRWLNDYLAQDKRVTCLFGEHLLNRFPDNPVALTEDPKTAIIAALYFGLPENHNDWIWLGVYNKSTFKFDNLKVLNGRFVYVFPDLSKNGSTFKEWKAKAKRIETKLTGTRFIFSDLLEKYAPESARENGDDIADFLIKLDWRNFQKTNSKEHKTESVKQTTKAVKQKPQRLNWRNYLKIPFETRCAIVEACKNEVELEELYKRFNVKPELIRLILNPNGGGL